MARYEPSFVSIEGGASSERRAVAEGLIAELRSRGVTATGLGRFGRRRLEDGDARPFWHADVVLLEGFADAGVPSIRLSRAANRSRRGGTAPLAWIETDGPAGSMGLDEQVRLAAGRLARHLAARRDAPVPTPDAATRRPARGSR